MRAVHIAPPAMLDGVLITRDLTVEIVSQDHRFNVVDGVDLTLEAGKTLGLVGESGSGKSMTGLALVGLLPPAGRVVRGSVALNGTELVGKPGKELSSVRGAEIGMIFQEPRRSLDPSFSVGYQVAEAIRRHLPVSRSEAMRRAVEMLDRVQIPRASERARNYPHQFSGGQCQRIMLAVALACRPKVLIADEPTTALDVTVQASVLRLIADLQREMDLAVLLITHDLGVVAEMCDRVAVMYAGQVVENADVNTLFRSPQHPYTWGLQTSVPDPLSPSSKIRSIRGVVPPPYMWPTGCRFHPRCEFAIDRCTTETPPMTKDAAGTLSRCLRSDELTLGDRPS